MKKVDNKIPYLYVHKEIYWYRRAFPKDMLRFTEKKTEFKRSLGTKILQQAIKNYGEKDKEYEEYIENCKSGNKIKEFDFYSKKAISRGLELEPLQDILKNAEKTKNIYSHYIKIPKEKRSRDDYLSCFNARKKDIKLSNIVDFYMDRQKYNMTDLNSDEIKKKKTYWKRSIRYLIESLSEDKFVSSIKRNDAFLFENFLREKLNDGKFSTNTANRHLMNIRTLLSDFNTSCGKYKETAFDNICFTNKRIKKNSRQSYSIGFIKNKWLTGDPFKDMHPEAKALLFAMIDTGCGHKELCGLDPQKDIKLDDEIPHIIIRVNDKRQIKSVARDRIIPLIGYALEAFEQFPQGFQKYSHPTGPDAASTALRKYLRDNVLNESKAHSPTCLRHLFKDRMRRWEFPEELQYYLMGHSWNKTGSKYGSFSLPLILKHMRKMESDFK